MRRAICEVCMRWKRNRRGVRREYDLRSICRGIKNDIIWKVLSRKGSKLFWTSLQE